MKRDLSFIKELSGNRLKELRTENNLSQAGLAALLETNQQSIQRYEKGTVKLQDYIAADIVKLFPKYRLEWLLGLDDIKTTEGKEFQNLLERKNQEWETMVDFIKLSAKRKGYTLRLYSTGMIGPSDSPEDCYIIQKGNTKSYIWISTLIDDMADYLDYKLTRILEKGDNNGKH